MFQYNYIKFTYTIQILIFYKKRYILHIHTQKDNNNITTQTAHNEQTTQTTQRHAK